MGSPPQDRARPSGFHSTKEVSKAVLARLGANTVPIVSIPLRKFPRDRAALASGSPFRSFHSTKEVSKAPSTAPWTLGITRFHSTKEVSKGHERPDTVGDALRFPFH